MTSKVRDSLSTRVSAYRRVAEYKLAELAGLQERRTWLAERARRDYGLDGASLKSFGKEGEKLSQGSRLKSREEIRSYTGEQALELLRIEELDKEIAKKERALDNTLERAAREERKLHATAKGKH